MSLQTHVPQISAGVDGRPSRGFHMRRPHKIRGGDGYVTASVILNDLMCLLPYLFLYKDVKYWFYSFKTQKNQYLVVHFSNVWDFR